MPIHVTNEIGKLKKVMLHRPGEELEHLVPEELERLLFDDIPYLKAARQEHDTFARVLRENGAEVVYLEDLMAETLQQNPELKDNLIRDVIHDGGAVAHSMAKEVTGYLEEITDEKELVLKMMCGITQRELRENSSHPLAELVNNNDRFILDPIPNLYFTRDPFACIGNGVSINRMYSATRRRETVFGRYIIKYHSDYKEKVPVYYKRNDLFHIEGGDILNLNEHVIAVGISQRTTPEAIETLARRIFADKNAKIDTVLAMDIPNVRSFMHLDTVLTQVDYDKFTVYPGILGSLRIFELKKGEKKDELRVCELQKNLADVLAEYLGCDSVHLIHCGGKDKVASAREQWNDGSNTLCIEPGKVVVYDRNDITNQILRRHGIEVLEIPSSELSRGRGGPRCMSMPLLREDI